MHYYLRAIGFSKIKTRKELLALFDAVMRGNHVTDEIEYDSGSYFAEIGMMFSEEYGVSLRGYYDEDGRFWQEYYFPFFKGSKVTEENELTIERYIDREYYLGRCEDIRLGVSLLFFPHNIIEYEKKFGLDGENSDVKIVFSALSIKGKVLLPIKKSQSAVLVDDETARKRNRLLSAARHGDEEAIENLALEDIDMYATLCKRVVQEDVLSIVDSSFMPYGIECDHYRVLGEIEHVSILKNRVTDEESYKLLINCNSFCFDVCINRQDLLGVPMPGRRFRGVIWMQGEIKEVNR